ncbi:MULTISPECIES: pyridoxal phosphate-dependent aminotransferase [unclassified Sorangium]|uniref:pyridoxal phosphate-dependent aminotransferase n=1 Tax=unclassified Sorangium TaxID=2621164 RepID=UPI003F62EF24
MTDVEREHPEEPGDLHGDEGRPSDPGAPAPAPPRRVEERAVHAFRKVPRTGVIYVTTEAARLGFKAGADEGADGWCNLGQGQPETGPLPGAPERCAAVPIAGDDQEYAPVAGLWELREAIASLYNRAYRRGMPSRYTAENVAVSGGGRIALTRAAAALGQINLGHFLPDYTAYEELLDVFRLFSPIPILLEGERGYSFSVGDLRREILGRGLSAILASNPCNPTGKHVRGEELAAWVRTAKELDCALLLDEFYSHYVYGMGDVAPMESAARYVEEVDRDPVVLFDGLTKNWRYPGWRVTWTLGPREVIEAVASAGSFLDGGGSKPMQRAAAELLTIEHTRAETTAIHRAFSRKRELMLAGLRKIGVTIDAAPEGTFYVWGSVADLPPGLSDGHGFFRAALGERVIVVPGEFFDVNPGKRRAGRPSRFRHHVRFSFGPSEDVLVRALGRLERMVGERRRA